MDQRTFAGRTEPGHTNWQQYQNGKGVFVVVDTSAGKFRTTPIYIISLGGLQNHWAVTGASCIYKPTPHSFMVVLRWSGDGPMSPGDIAPFQWHVNWMGIENIKSDSD